MRRALSVLMVPLLCVACGGGGGKDDPGTDVVDAIEAISVDLPSETAPEEVATPDAEEDSSVPDTFAGSTRRIEFLVDVSLPIAVNPKMAYTIRAKLVDKETGAGVPNVSVSFKIVKVTEGPGGEEILEYDGALTTSAAITDGNGRVDGVFQAAESTGLLYKIELAAKDSDPARMDIMVTAMDCAKIDVGVTYDGSLSAAASFLVTVLSPDAKCADLVAGDLPNPVDETVGTDFTVPAQVACVPPNSTFTVFVTAKEACPFASGCVEGVATQGKDSVAAVTVPLAGVDVTMDGTYTGVHKFQLTDVLPADCAGVVEASACASPNALPFNQLACCYLGAIESFFRTDAAGFAAAMKARAAAWSGTKVPAGQEAAFDAAVDSTMTDYLSTKTPDWVASYAAVSKWVLQAVRTVNLASTLTLQPEDPDGIVQGTTKWSAYTIYWKLGCEGSPDYANCGKTTYANDRFGGLAYTPTIAQSGFGLARTTGNLFSIAAHTVAMNPGRLLAFVANDIAANALSGGVIRDGIYKDGLAKNVTEAAGVWVACADVAASLKTRAGASFNGTEADLQSMCQQSLEGLLAPIGTLLTSVARNASLEISGTGSWTDTNCDLKTDRFQEGAYAGTFQPPSGEPVAITGSFSANRK